MTDSPQSFQSRATVAIELLKRTRTEWVTRPALAKALGVKIDTANRWVAEFVANGLLVERMGTKPEAAPGSAPMEYRLAPEWGGAVEPPPAAELAVTPEPEPAVVVIVAEPEPEDTEPLPADPKWPSFNSVPLGCNPDTGRVWAAAGEPA